MTIDDLMRIECLWCENEATQRIYGDKCVLFFCDSCALAHAEYQVANEQEDN